MLARFDRYDPGNDIVVLHGPAGRLLISSLAGPADAHVEPDAATGTITVTLPSHAPVAILER